MRTVMVLGALLALGTGCSSKASQTGDGGVDGPSDGPPRVCVPGRAVACTGSGGCAGGQACVENGTGYSPCDCGWDGAVDDGSAGDAVLQDDGGVDGSPDVRIDDGPTPSDTGGSCSADQHCPDGGYCYLAISRCYTPGTCMVNEECPSLGCGFSGQCVSVYGVYRCVCNGAGCGQPTPYPTACRPHEYCNAAAGDYSCH